MRRYRGVGSARPMCPRPTFPRLLGTCLLTCVVAMLVSAPAGLSVGTPSVGGGSPQYTAATAATIGWSAVDPDPGYDSIAYEGDLSGATFSTTDTSTGVTLGSPGTYTFRVRAVETDSLNLLPPVSGAYGVATIVVDRTPPTISVALSPAAPNGDNGWYTSLSINWTCTDDGAPVTSCPASGRYRTQGANQTRSGAATNAAGLTSSPVTTPIFNFDRRPRPGRRPCASRRRAPPSPASRPSCGPRPPAAPRPRGTTAMRCGRASRAPTARSPSCPSSRDRPSTARRATRPCGPP